jgi:Xaa-Pro aminopeptidase
MKTDLDALIRGAGLDAVLVLGDAAHNPAMYYLTGGGHVSEAALFIRPGHPATLYCHAMERAEAAKSGLQVFPLSKSPMETLAKEPGEILKREGIAAGRLGIYGNLDAGNLMVILESLRRALPSLELVGEAREDSIFLRAMETKDDAEVAHIRRMGRITAEVVGLVAQYLTTCDVREDELLTKADGSILKVSDVKRMISLWLAERGAEEVEGCIFAIGRDAGVPHSVGDPEDPLRLGQTIVFDIFPAEAGGGYFYDFTRTWTLGYATTQSQRLYDEVKDVYDKVVENLDLNVSFKEYQKLACDAFASEGHQTPMDAGGILECGYVHSLGHGVGLNIHERPWSRHTAPAENLLRPGVVVTIEPGLYYPDQNMGVRIEDTFWVRPDGKVDRLAEYPYDFVLPMKKWDGRRKESSGA